MSEKAEPETKDEAPLVPAAVVHPEPPPAMPKQAWAAPLLRIDQAWAAFEVKLATAVLVAEVVALVAWVTLKGLAAEYQASSANRTGLVVRAVLGGVALGLVVRRVLAGRVAERQRSIATTLAVIGGALAARLWANAGAPYFANLLNWFQSASTLTLIGGLSGVATRLTLWLALLGGAIATSQGKHINVDVVMRFLSPRLRVIVASVGWIAASIVCTTAVWGFVDDIAIGHFLAPADAPPKEKLSHVAHESRTDLFLLGRQISLDLKSLPHVVTGEPYSGFLKAKEWNEWLRAGDWSSRFKPDDVKLLELPDDQAAARLPIITVPGSSENVPGLLVRDFDLIVPFGLLVLAIRLLLRAVLALTGHVRVDPDAAHGDEDIEAAQSALHSRKGQAS
ncbi:MAG: TRAP transporter small permease subunit [Polyangiaceae bacterium]